MLITIRSTLKNTLIYSVGTFSSKLIGFVLLPLYTSKLAVGEYGILSILEISSQILIAIFGLGLFNAFFRWYWDQQYQGKQKSILFTLLVSVLGFSLIIGSILWMGASGISVFLFDTQTYEHVVRVLIFICVVEAQNILILTLLRIREKAGLYSILTTLKFTIQLLLTVYFIVYAGKKIEGIYEAQLIASLLFYIAATVIVLRNIQPRFEFRILKEMFIFSLPLLFTAISGIILSVTDRYSLKFLGTLEDVGVYSLGFKIANILRTFVVTSVNMALYPVIYKMMDQPGNKRFYAKTMTYYAFGLMFFILGISFFGMEIVKVMARQTAYWAAFSIIPVISFSIFFGMLRDVAMTGINLTKKTQVTAIIIFTVTVLNLVLNIITIPVWGYYGAAVSTLTAQIIYFVLIYRFSQKFFSIPYELKKIALLLVTGIMLVVISQLFNSWSLGFRIVAKIFLVVIFPFMLYPFGFFEHIELERIQQIWHTWKNPLNWRKEIGRIFREDKNPEA